MDLVYRISWGIPIRPQDIELGGADPIGAPDFESNPLRGLFGDPRWEWTAMELVWVSQKFGGGDWVGKCGFSYPFQSKAMIDGMIRAGFLEEVTNSCNRGGWALTDKAIELLPRKTPLWKSRNYSN